MIKTFEAFLDTDLGSRLWIILCMFLVCLTIWLWDRGIDQDEECENQRAKERAEKEDQ